MQKFDITKEDKDLIPVLVNLKMELQEERDCPNYFFFAKLKTDSKRMLLEIPSKEKEEVRTIKENLRVETVPVRLDDVANGDSDLPFKIVTAYHVIVQIDLILMEIRPKISSLADDCNDCICAVETGNCKSDILKKFTYKTQLTNQDYKDCHEPGKLPSDTVKAAWKRCSSDYECSLNCTNAYYARHKHLCDESNMSELNEPEYTVGVGKPEYTKLNFLSEELMVL
ncbi:unnamed protein product, partial [Mesorhabditis belari]|uniref:lysozyme n=1 Tax=Mesorhabditis belari TaxID=2138241 RepID=A0AAF3EE96_9BILA